MLRCLRYAVCRGMTSQFRQITIVVALLAALIQAGISAEQRRSPISINGRIPLGIESFRSMPSRSDFYLMASAESPSFDSMVRVIEVNQEYLVANGKRVSLYPEKVSFRLTASARERLLDEHPFQTNQEIALGDLFLKLKFRLKVFHGLEYHYIQPTGIEEMGMPKDIPYDERIYRISFTLGKVPIEDRVVMEVLSPTGERLCKFHLDLL